MPRNFGTLAWYARAAPGVAILPYRWQDEPVSDELSCGAGSRVAHVVRSVENTTSEWCGDKGPMLFRRSVTVD